MARTHTADPIMAFRFTAEFFARANGEDDQGRRTTDFKRLNDPKKIGFTSVGVGSRGFEVWRGLFHDEPSIFPVISEAKIVECIAYGRPGKDDKVKAKVFTFGLGDRIKDEGAIHLPMVVDPMIVGATIAQERGLNAISSSIVMEGVLWPNWRLISIKNKTLPLPG